MIQEFCIVFCVVLGAVHSYGELPSASKAVNEANQDFRQYHGIIKENALEGDIVELDKELVCRNRDGLTGDQICGYTLYKSHSELPFKVVLRDRDTGRADIVVTAPVLDYERRHKYNFEIAAHDCITGTHTKQRERVHIEVEDVDDHDPEWKQEAVYSKVVDVPEGRMLTNILQLELDDKDGSDKYSKICRFHILTPGAPFSIDEEGVLSNTEPLSYEEKHNHILEVRAEDCGGKQSTTLLINIRVLAQCHPGWKDIAARVSFTPGSSGHQPLAPGAHLEVCPQTCTPASVSTHVTLTTDHIGKGCDRDTYSIHSQRKLCGASESIHDLLPNPAFGSWTKSLPSDDGSESDLIFAFDGKTNAIEVPNTKFNHTLESEFSISTWMKHEPAENEDDKEHLLCNADGEKMNRHHYSVFVHHCRLVLLLRREPGQASGADDLNVFRPAEWRFSRPEICDGQWHHYTINVNFPEVNLYVDGKRHVAEKHNPEIVDDWPLHPSKKIHFTKLVVGACWMGGTKHLTQYFKGYLAGLSILNGQTESDRVITCLNNCKEKLDFHAMNEMETGMSVEFNSEMTMMTINGHDVANVERLIRKIGYINSRLYPTPGHRALTLTTQVTCTDGHALEIAPVESLVVVQSAEEPIITIEGATSLQHPEGDYPHGVKIFPGMHITVETRKEAEEKEEKPLTDTSEQETKQKSDDKNEKEDTRKESDNIFAANRYKLDSCIIKINPPMNQDVEHLTYPENMLSQLMVEAYQNENGLVFSGAEAIEHYASILSQVQYVNSAPGDVKHRIFLLTCSELNGRFVSNQFKVQADVIHILHEDVHIPQAHAKETKFYETVKNYKELDNQVAGKAEYMSNNIGVHSGAGVGMIVIIVVCVGFLAFMIVLGVVRIRAAHHRSAGVHHDAEEKPEMEWDNSALTITVNPMDQENVFEEEHELNGLPDDDTSDDDDDDGSSFHDDLESSEEEAEKVKDRELEWDDSTLTF